ncbi:MAG: PQQ-dependent sugar dehydrogenase [Halobacteriovoraceae bacterium]|nr:PQQ-dependent sugar dehydrogenase [Halobacteriovoraceae bacterium]MCB9095267.1 PQQ-dependent sugar dehydrogenase [Halobacteriovoraceae bacterium]
MKFGVEKIVEGLGIPWGFAFLDSENMIVTIKKGEIIVLNLKSKSITNIKGVPKVLDDGQGGLLDIHLHPNYPNVPWVYITYVEEIESQGATVLARFQLKNNKIEKFEKILVTKSRTSTSRHFGSRITFDNRGLLYFSVGERGVRKNAQDLSVHAGSILRLTDDGKIPSDNPFIQDEKKLSEIWSYGHRNPQGLVFDSKRNILWEIEHGPRGGDEINRLESGKNYGWPVISFGKEYWGPVAVGESTHKKGMEQPVYQYTPSIAPCGLEVYSGKLFKKWEGDLFTGALKLTHINRVVLKDNKFVKEQRLLEKLHWRIRNIKEGPEGALYFSTDNGKILRIVPIKN